MKLLFIGLDAFDRDVLAERAAAGELPNIAALLARSVSAETDTDPGTFVGSLWATIHTGVTPGEHGIFCWAETEPGTYNFRFSDERNVAAPSFWTRLSSAGFRSAVLDVPHTKLDRTINGFHVVNWFSHFKTVEGFAAEPPELATEIERRFGLDPYPHCNHVGRSAEELAAFAAALLRRVEGRTELMLEKLAAENYDLGVVVFGEVHCGGHQFYNVFDPAGDPQAIALRQQIGDPLMEIYRAIDRSIGRLVAAVPADCAVLLVASHGMGPHFDGAHLAERFLRRVDRAIDVIPPVPVGRRLLDLVEANRIRRHLGLLGRLLPRELPRRAHSRVFVVPNNESYLGIRVNLEGREPAGLVREADFRRFVDALETMVMSTRRGDGTPAFANAVRSERAYGVDHRASGLPDLMFGWDRRGPFDALEIAGIGRIEGNSPSVRSGDHREGGLLLLATPPGETVNLAPRLASHEIADIVLARFGLPGPMRRSAVA